MELVLACWSVGCIQTQQAVGLWWSWGCCLPSGGWDRAQGIRSLRWCRPPCRQSWGLGSLAAGPGVCPLVGRAEAQGVPRLVPTHWWVSPGPGASAGSLVGGASPKVSGCRALELPELVRWSLLCWARTQWLVPAQWWVRLILGLMRAHL